MGKVRRVWTLGVLVALLVATGLMSGVELVPASASVARPATVDLQEVTTGRLAGKNRGGTAVEISGHSFPSGSRVVYLARQDVFADALAAGVLTDGPVLLVPSCGTVPQSVAAEIDRLDPERVIALGGTAAICQQTLDDAGKGRAKSRLAGGDRFGTAVAISRYQFPSSIEEVYLANSNSPDAVAGGMLTRGPVLLTRKGGVPAVVRQELRRLSPKVVVALGGEAAISKSTLFEALDASGGGGVRLAGSDRYATAVEIASYEFSTRAPSTVYLARGDVFADAVASGSLTDGPVLLVKSCNGIPQRVADALASMQPRSVVALGGVSAVCEKTLQEAAETVRDAALRITTTNLPEAQRGEWYDSTLRAAGGQSDYYSWHITSGTLPEGLTFRSSGRIYGVPVQEGAFAFTVTLLCDSTTASADMLLTVQPATASER